MWINNVGIRMGPKYGHEDKNLCFLEFTDEVSVALNGLGK